MLLNNLLSQCKIEKKTEKSITCFLIKYLQTSKNSGEISTSGYYKETCKMYNLGLCFYNFVEIFISAVSIKPT